MTFNTCGLGNYKKRTEVLNKFWYPLGSKPPDILFLQECHSTIESEGKWKKDFRSQHVYFNHDTATAGGLVIAVRNTLPFTLKHLITGTDYMLVHCEIAREEYVLVNIHNRHFGTSKYQQKLIDWFHKIWGAVQQFPCHRILMAGDFNLRLDPELSGVSASYHHKQGTDILQTFIEETDLTDCWRLCHPNDIRYTYHTKRKSWVGGSCLDFFLASPLLVNYLISSDIELAFQSDHSPVSASFLLYRNPRGKGIFRFPNFLVSDA